MRWSVGSALIVVLLQGAPEALQEADPRRSGPEEGVGPFLTKYCLKCHGPEKPKGKFTLPDSGAVDAARVPAWKQILEKLHDGEMPPEDAPQPSTKERAEALRRIKAGLAKAGEGAESDSPSKGNAVDHDALFSGKTSAGAATPARVWRLTDRAYENFFLQVAKKWGGGRVTSPWELTPQRGFNDYASVHRIDEADLEQHLRNATRIAHALVTQRLAKGSGPSELRAVVKAGASATSPEVQAAVGCAFQDVLGRRPTSEEQARYAGFLGKNLKSLEPEPAVEQILLAVLLHPEAVYRVEAPPGAGTRARLEPAELARAIAYALTDQGPDGALLETASSGKLSAREEVGAQVARLLGDPKIAKPRILKFFQEYFGYPAAVEVFKDAPAVKAAGLKHYTWVPLFFVSDTNKLIQSVLEQDRNVLRELLTTSETFVLTIPTGHLMAEVRKNAAEKAPKFTNPRTINILQIYEMDLRPADWSERPLALPEGHRMGILTHPSWLVAHSTNFENHAIRRGRWIREKLLGGRIPDVPVTVDAQLPDEPQSTLRERMRVTRKEYCWKCHQQMDPLGLPFERFDHFGQYRTTELGKPVDAAGAILRSGDARLDGPVQDPFDLIRRLAASERVEQVFVRHAFRFFLGRNETLEDGPALVEAHRAYVSSGGSMKALITSLLTSDPFLYRIQRSER